MKKLNISLVFVILIFVLLFTILLGVSLGTVRIPLVETYKTIMDKLLNLEAANEIYTGVIWQLRMPRVFMGLITGAGLSLCGIVMQAVVQNPLAEPFLLGISAGGYLGATIFIILGSGLFGAFNTFGLAFTAFLGALSAAVSVLFLASFKSRISTTKLILSGTIVNALFNAIANFIVVFSGTENTIARVTYWTMGSLSSAKWDNILLPAVAVILSIVYFFTQYRTLNTMFQGEEVAITLGINVNFYRKIYTVLVALLTGILVSTCGIISFVGLIIPHVSRALVGPDHRKLIPITVLTGSIFLVVVDILARTMVENNELPIGIFTSIVGAPFFAFIMIQKNYQFKD
ncbi:putative ABC transporter permease protein [Tetragenococcus halophilus subsp. halophilus]|uniref:FecCD family ABC transporter permease n=1 Tax=Tetragenococcus halophilus TaxID=51669 RepID=UPI000CAEAAE5|nr:iron ABC transporter permease [Tetragenococcus halophilus]GBD81072.1 putative ABC transporter permease protein [Tetragenococcus halophilus subsp. halophilus]GBD81929.1 putative ABC transporter permease protein [Tetragenococcus halophilus subsp. halophilus]